MNEVIISLLLVAILALIPILLKDIFGITFTKKTKEVSVSEVKNKLKNKVGKIKPDYLLLGFVFFGMVAFIFYSFLNNRGSSPKIPATLQWLLASIITVLVVFLAIKVIKKDRSKKQTVKKPGAENGGLLRKKTNTLKSWISWGNVLSILLLIGLGVFVYYQVTKPEEPGPNQTGWIPVKSSNSEITDISSYKELKIGETDSFEANVWKKFKFSTSNTKEQKYLNFYLSKSSKDTITLTFKQVSNGREWSWKHWIDKQGDSQCTLHSGELIAFKGDCLVKVDKGCSFNCLIK